MTDLWERNQLLWEVVWKYFPGATGDLHEWLWEIFI